MPHVCEGFEGLNRVGRALPLRYLGRRRNRELSANRGTGLNVMARVSVAERTKLSAFLVRGATRRLLGRVLAHPVLQWPFSFGKPDRLVIAPQDLRTTDATRASEIYAGRFAFAGKVVVCDRRSPFEMTPPSAEWRS